MKIFPVFKKVITIISGGVVNWLASLRGAVNFGTVLTAIIGTIKAAARVTQSGFTLLSSQKPAGSIPRIFIELAQATHVVTGSNDTGNVTNWTTPTNIQGAPDAAFSTFQGAVLLGSGVLRGAMVAQFNKTSLEIGSVYLDFYGKVAGLPVVSDLVSNLTLRYRVGGVTAVEKTLQAISTGANDFSVTPLSFRIDDGAGKFTDGATPALSTAVTWANIDLLSPDWSASTLAGLVGALYSADAVRLRVNGYTYWYPPTDSLP